MIPSLPRVSAAAEELHREQAVGELYRQHVTGLVRLALMLVGDQPSAEDVVQEAFLGLYRNWPGLDDRDRVDGYLRVAVVNGSRGVLRARRRAWLRPVRHDPPVWSAEAAAMATEERRLVLAAVAGLPRRQREVLALRYYATASGQQVKVLHRWSAADQPGPVVIDPAGGYALIPITVTPARQELSPFVKGDHCVVVHVHRTPMCQQVNPSHTGFVSINLASGTATTLPFRESGPAFWGMAAW